MSASAALRGELLRDGLLSALAAVVAAVCLTLAVEPPRPPASPQSLGVVAEARGAVRRRVAQALGWFPAAVDERLADGDVLFAPAGALAVVRLDDGSELTVAEDSLVVLAPKAAQARVRVERGAVAVRSGAASLVLSTSSGDVTVAARGSAELLTRGDAVELSVSEGEARLLGATVASGQHTAARAGAVARPTAWSVRLVSPAADYTQHFVHTPKPVELTVAGDVPDGAEVVVALGRDFGRVVHRASAAAAVVFTPNKPGSYWWRAVDASGAAVSEARRVSVVEDVPPVPVRPLEGRLVQAPQGTAVEFSWAPVAGARAYELEFSGSRRFESVAFSAQARSSTARLPVSLDEGEWHWRVRAGEGTPGLRPWSRVASFRLIHRAVPDAPELLAPEVEVEP